MPPVLLPRTRHLNLLRPRLSAGYFGGLILVLIAAACFLTLPWSIHRYGVDLRAMAAGQQLHPPTLSEPAMWLGTDENATPLLWRCLLGGAISLTIGITAAGVAVVIGTLWGGVRGLPRREDGRGDDADRRCALRPALHIAGGIDLHGAAARV